MDEALREHERRAAAPGAAPADLIAYARGLARAGEPARAREALSRRLRAAHVDPDVLEALLALAEAEGRVVRRAAPPRRVHVPMALTPAGAHPPQAGDPLASPPPEEPAPREGESDPVLAAPAGDWELAPSVVLAGSSAGVAYAAAVGLLRLFGPAAADHVAARVGDEAHLHFSVALRSPWPVAPGFVVRTLRVATVPSATPRSGLQDASAVAFVLGDRDALDPALADLGSDLRRAHGCGPSAIPFAVLHAPGRDVDVAGLDRAAVRVAAAPGRGEAPGPDDEGLAEAVALLLLSLARGVRTFLRPRLGAGPAAATEVALRRGRARPRGARGA